jgi:hypothetical protein
MPSTASMALRREKLTRYGSPMAKAANERVAVARKLLGEVQG